MPMDELVYRQVLRIKAVTQGHDDAFRVSGLGTFVLKPEGTPVSFDDPVQGIRRRVIISTFALGYRTTMEAEEDEQFDILDQFPADLGDAGKDHQENLGASVFNDAFAGATFTGLDALSLVNTLHTILKPRDPAANTQSNQLAPGVALSVTGLEDALTNLRTTQDENGRQIGASLRPRTLLVPPELAFEAQRLMDSTLEPGTSENQINTVSSSNTGMSTVVWPHLTDGDAWFILVEQGKVGTVWLNRKEMQFSPGQDNITFDRLFTSHYRAQIAVREWRGIVGSNAS
jgi:hypothetical protein